MRDPHVEELYYEIVTGEGISFGNPPPLSLTNQLGTFELSSGKLTIRPTDHYPSGVEARAVFDPFLRAWEVDADLTRYIGSIRFTFLSVLKVDRNAPESGAVSLAPESGELVFTGYAPTVLITQNTYPPPPEDFRTTPEVNLAYQRWRAFREGREPLQSMAYAVLTLVEAVAGSRRQAAILFQIDFDLLNTIGRLASTKGDGATARKFQAGAPPQDLAGGESSWLEAAVRRVVRRMGEHAAGASPSALTMKDLPAL